MLQTIDYSTCRRSARKKRRNWRIFWPNLLWEHEGTSEKGKVKREKGKIKTTYENAKRIVGVRQKTVRSARRRQTFSTADVRVGGG